MKKFQWLNPTIIGSDEEKATQAHILSLLIWASWGTFVFVFFTALYFNDWKSVGVILACSVLLIAPFALLKRGHLAASSLFIVLMMIITITIIATVGQGIRDMAIIAFPIVFIFAGLTLNRVYFRLFVGLTLAAMSWLAFGEDYGWFVTQPLNYSNWLYLITLIIILLVAALAVDRMAINMRKSLELARQEISERILMEEELRESQELLSLFVRHSPIYTYIKTVTPTEDRLLLASENMYELIGVSSDQTIVGKTMAELFPPEFAEKISEDDRAVVTRGEVLKLDEDLNGNHYSTIKFPLVQGGKTLLGGYSIDITERKRTEEIALASQKLASLGNLAAGMAHEINNPLQVITGLSQRLVRKLNADQIDKQQFLTDLEKLNKNSWRIAKIVRSLLAYSRQSATEFAPHQLNDIIEETLLLIEHQLKSWSNIIIEKELAADLPLVHCDSNNITQVIINLLENAKDAMLGGGWIKISTSYSLENEQVILLVSDNGEGIPAEIKSKIFDPFFTSKDVDKGTGLGLSIVQGIVERHCGEITFESDPDKGTAFTICFPKEPPPLAASNKVPNGRYD
ncbi:MAG: PAS domain-containing protein [Anaerolineaceae bacterium]|nr:PAS domain-containing protein [Anaerolineaceae bacterium]